eukprot:1517464-Rhodomonas_salina.1
MEGGVAGVPRRGRRHHGLDSSDTPARHDLRCEPSLPTELTNSSFFCIRTVRPVSRSDHAAPLPSTFRLPRQEVVLISASAGHDPCSWGGDLHCVGLR